MTMTPRRWGAVVVALVVLAAAIGLFRAHPRVEPKAPTSFVPVSFKEAQGSPMHVAHLERGHVACQTCHTAGMGPKVDLGVCAGCHAAATAHAHKGSATLGTTCVDCHNFSPSTPTKPCASCHTEGSKLGGLPLLAHGREGTSCRSCHTIHAPAPPKAAAGPCASCHVVAARHGARATTTAGAVTGRDHPSTTGATATGAAATQVGASSRELAQRAETLRREVDRFLEGVRAA